MAKETPSQKATVHRVMHEFKTGALKRSEGGKGGKVKNPKQAVAIALSEAGVSNRKSEGRNAQSASRGETRAELYAKAKRRGIEGRSTMNKAELERALRRH